MAKSKGKVELQVEIKTQDQWDELLTKEGLIVVDAYSAWCGPCKAIVSSFKRIKNELGDDLLVFATAETDSIDSLEGYRMKSQPTFLFYAGGILVNVVRGCNCPVLIKSIRSELEKEHKVLDGTSERVPFVDQVAMKEPVTDEKKDEEMEAEEEEEELVELPKQVTVAIIKPDAVKAGLVDEILQKVEEAGMEVLKKEEKILSREEAAEFYKQHEGTEHFDQLVEFMSSGPCMTLALSKAGDSPEAGGGAIDYFRDLIGPKDVNIAKEEAPTSLRALYGTDTVMNAVHGCDSAESAARELAFFYPDFVAPTIIQKRKKKRLQRTLALIRPDALRTRRESILAKIEEAGFTIAMSKEITLSREQAENFYAEHKDADFFETLVANMTSGPMLALCLAREDAVEGWRELLGPKEIPTAAEQAPDSLRHQFHVEDSPINPLHGSDSTEAAEKEIQHFFPVQSTVAVIKPEMEPDKRDEVIQRIKEAGFKIQFEKEVTLTKELAATFYHEHEGKEFYDGLTDHMASGPTLFMVLTKEDAISGWRALMGPTDPQQAVEVAPNSLRAQFGVDTMKNAVHGSSDAERAEAVIKQFLPEVEILPNGTVRVPKDESKPDAEDSQQQVDVQRTEELEERYNKPLGMENGSIPNDAIKASSELDEPHSASRARLNIKPEGELMGAWVPLESDENQWLQVDLGKATRLTKIAVQGEAGESPRHVKEFTVSCSLDGETFLPYREEGTEKVFEGNSDQDTVVLNSLKNPLITQFLRVQPKTWNEGIAVRTEFYGCNADEYSEAVGMESGSIPNDAIKASSELDEKHSASKARLGIKPEDEQFGAWVPLESDENQWLQVDLGKIVEITKVSTQGGCDGADHRVTSYVLSFGEDQENFQEYQEQGEIKVFEGNLDTDTAASHWLVYPVKARYCTLKPKTWNEQIALRLELYGKVVSDNEPVRDQQPQEPTQVADDTAGDKDEAQPQVVQEGGESQQSEVQPSQGEADAVQEGDENAQAPEEVKEGEGDESKPDEGQKAEGVGESVEDESKPDEGQKSEEVGEAANDESQPEEVKESEEVKEGAGDEVKPDEGQKPEEVSESGQDESTPEEGEKSEEVKENADAESKPEEGQKSEEVPENADAESKPEEGQKPEEIPENVNDENKPEEGVKSGESAEESAQPDGGVGDQAETK